MKTKEKLLYLEFNKTKLVRKGDKFGHIIHFFPFRINLFYDCYNNDHSSRIWS